MQLAHPIMIFLRLFQRQPHLMLLLAASLIFAVVSGCGSHWSEADLQATKRSGDVIANALSDYKADRGRFPDKLEDLVPSFLPNFPDAPTGGGKWQYRRKSVWTNAGDDDDFQLVAAAPGGYPSLSRSSKSQTWWLDQ